MRRLRFRAEALLIALLDTGGTCGSSAERLFAEVYARVSIDIASGKYKWGDRDCPVREIRDFSKDPQSMMGFKKGTSVETRFFVVLRLVFTPVGKGSPHVVAVKVTPADSAGFPGIVLGLPTLGPKGLQHRAVEPGHRFEKLKTT